MRFIVLICLHFTAKLFILSKENTLRIVPTMPREQRMETLFQNK